MPTLSAEATVKELWNDPGDPTVSKLTSSTYMYPGYGKVMSSDSSSVSAPYGHTVLFQLYELPADMTTTAPFPDNPSMIS